MRTTRFISHGAGRQPQRGTIGGAVYGLIDWDGVPILIVGGGAERVTREAIRIFTHIADDSGSLIDENPGFTTRHPIPEPDAP